MRRLTGFTLVELLVTLSLVALVAGAVVAVMSGGLQIWERLQDQDALGQQLQIVLDSMRRELHNAQPFRPIPFEGSYDTFSFPALLEMDTADGLHLREVGRVGFFLDEGRHRLCKSQQPYRGLRSQLLKESCRPLIEGIDRLRFSYYVLDSSTGQYDWTGSWTADQPPLAVKIEVGYRESPKDKLSTKVLIVHFPTATVR